MKHNVLKSDQSLTRKWICALILLLCAFNTSQVLGKNDKSKLRIEKLGDKYIYTIGEMRNVFSASFDSASYFTDDNLAIVYDSLYYVINLKGERVSPFFQQIERHKSGLYIGKESDKSGYAIYDVSFSKMTNHPFDKIWEHKENLFKCISPKHLTFITTRGFVLADLDIDFEHSGCQNWYPNYILSHKERETNDIRAEIYDYTIFRFKNTNGGYTVAFFDYEGNKLVDFKDYKKAAKELKKLKNKTLIPLYKKFWEEKHNAFANCGNVLAENIKRSAELYPTEFVTPVFATIATQKQIKNKKGKITTKAGQYFVKNGTTEKISEVYKSISHLGSSYFLVKDYDNKYALANKSGQLFTGMIYDDFSLWSDGRSPIYRYSMDGKSGLMKLPQEEVLSCAFEEIGEITNDFAIASKIDKGQKKYFVVNKAGAFITTYAYDNIIKDKKGTYSATLGEGETALTATLDPITGKETSPTIQEQFFHRVVNIDMEPNDMIEAYDIIIMLGGPLTAAAYNNKGVAYEELDDLAMARECYEKAKSLGDETAADNLRQLDEEEAEKAEEMRRRIEQQKLEKQKARQENVDLVVNLLGSVAELFGGNSTSTSYESSSYSNYDSDHSYSSGSTGSSTSTNKVRANDKCHMCLGSGECLVQNAHSKSACGGSGKCGTCGGTGVLHVAGAPDTFCPNCDKNHNGKCKRCHGTGKCPICHGTGLK